MIEVRIREVEEQVTAVHLGEVPFTATELDKALNLVECWSVRGPSGTVFGRGEISGQITVDDTAAYFELLLEADE